MSKIRYNSVLATITNTNNELFVIREIRELRIIDPCRQAIPIFLIFMAAKLKK
jgi:hypothetical protein